MKKMFLISDEFYGGFQASTSELKLVTPKEYLERKHTDYGYDDGCYSQTTYIKTVFIEDKISHKHGKVLGYNRIVQFEREFGHWPKKRKIEMRERSCKSLTLEQMFDYLPF